MRGPKGRLRRLKSVRRTILRVPVETASTGWITFVDSAEPAVLALRGAFETFAAVLDARALVKDGESGGVASDVGGEGGDVGDGEG